MAYITGRCLLRGKIEFSISNRFASRKFFFLKIWKKHLLIEGLIMSALLMCYSLTFTNGVL